MRIIDLATWSRRTQFEVFRTWDYPHFNICANVDLSVFRPAVKERGVSFTVAMVYVVAHAANAMPEFRYRIRGETAVEHDVVHPSTTVLLDDDQFTFCVFEYIPDFAQFAAQAAARIAAVKENATLRNEPGQDDLLYTTSLPWVAFTSCMHPLNFPVDSIPRIAWGKFFPVGEGWQMPLSVQGHHALMDGVHVGRYYERVQDLLCDPGFMFEG